MPSMIVEHLKALFEVADAWWEYEIKDQDYVGVVVIKPTFSTDPYDGLVHHLNRIREAIHNFTSDVGSGMPETFRIIGGQHGGS